MNLNRQELSELLKQRANKAAEAYVSDNTSWAEVKEHTDAFEEIASEFVRRCREKIL